MELISKTYPDNIVINPEGLNAVTLVQMLYETDENYYPITRKYIEVENLWKSMCLMI